MNWIPFASVFLAALAGTLATEPVARRVAVALGAVDMPSKRRVNVRPVPRMGGIAILCGLILACIVQYLGTTRLQLKPLPKLLGQVAAASIAAASGLVIGDIVNPFAGGEIALGWLAYPITVIYLVAFANIINLIDGLDGLAAGITCISSFTMFVLAVLAHRMDAAALSIALCGATLGFLRYNFNPASIFMGDSGSLLLGFLLGVISLLSVARVAGLTTLLLPLVLAGIPIIDTFSAIVRRRRAHVSVGHADKGHIHHRLIEEGFDQRQAVVLIYLWTAALCLGAVVMTQVEPLPRILVLAFLVAMSALFAMRLKLFTPVLLHHYDTQGRDELIGPDDPEFEEEAHRQHMG